MRELRELDGDMSEIYSTHPPMVVRVRALLWFSMSEAYERHYGAVEATGLSMSQVESRIEKDLVDALGKAHRGREQRHLVDAVMWLHVHDLASDGLYSKQDQMETARLFGEECREKIAEFLANQSKSKCLRKLENRRCDALSALRSASPASIAALVGEFRELAPLVEGALGDA
jgi:hypothetical protein